MQKTLNIFRYIILGGIGLTPFIALIVSGNLFFPFITGKNFAFRILIETIFGLWIMLAIFDKKYRPKRTVIFWAVAAFTLAVILSTIFGVNIYRSFWSNYERMEGLITYLHLFAYFIVLGSVMGESVIPAVKSTKDLNWKILFHISLAVCAIVGIYALLQYGGKLETHQGDRLDATLGNSSYLAIYVVFHIFLSVMYFFREKEWYRWLYAPLVILFLFDLYYTATRGAILGLIGGVVIFAGIIAWLSPHKHAKKIAVSCLIAIVVAGGIFWRLRNLPYIKQSPVLGRFASISVDETTTQSRLVIWKMSLAGFKDKPLFGWGPENYNLVFNKYYEPILWKQEAWFDRAHNVFIDKLIENGILGLGTYLGIFGCFIYCLWARRIKMGLSVYDSSALTAMFAAYFCHNFFVFDNIVSLILFFTFLAYIHSLVVEGDVKDETEALGANNKNIKKEGKIDESDLGQKSAYSVIVGLLTIAVIYFVNVPGMLAASDLIYAFGTANVPQQPGFIESGQKAEDYYKKAFEYFKQAIARGSFGTTETQEHLSRFAIELISIPADLKINASNEFKTEVYNTAVQELKNQMVRLPGDIRTMVFLGSLYGRGGRFDQKQYDNDIEIMTKAIELSPRKQMLYFELGFAHLNIGQYQKAVDTLKIAFELDEEYLEARKIYAMAAIYNNQDQVAEDLMKDFGGLSSYDDRFLNAFYKMKKFDRVIAMLEKTIAGNPKDFDHRLNLAGVYLEVGRRVEAIKLLEEASALNPAFKPQGDAFIKEIKAGKNP